jgi:hypothetical protein
MAEGRNRDERRTVTVFDPAEKFATTEWHPHVAAIVRVERKVFSRIVSSGLWDRSTETAFYVSNTKPTALGATDAIRGHWQIETTSHYSRDVTFGEDRSRIRANPSVFARLRSFAFNILKSHKTSTLSQDRYRAALGPPSSPGDSIALNSLALTGREWEMRRDTLLSHTGSCPANRVHLNSRPTRAASSRSTRSQWSIERKWDHQTIGSPTEPLACDFEQIVW